MHESAVVMFVMPLVIEIQLVDFVGLILAKPSSAIHAATAHFACSMSATSMSTAEHTNMELQESAIDRTLVDPAAAAAAAAMSDLSDLATAAIAGQLLIWRRVPACSKQKPR
jgi:hypothetical protein